MARCNVAGFLLVFVLHLHASIGATLSADAESVMRRQLEHRVQLSSHGEMIHAGDNQKRREVSKPQSVPEETCNLDFPVGTEGDINCPAGGKVIMDPARCKVAADQSYASHTQPDQEVELGTPARWEYHHPAGCYYQACPKDHKESPACYYYNGIGGTPDAANNTGRIVCERPKLVNGTDGEAGGCPDGYEVIDDEYICDSAAECLGYTPNEQGKRIGMKNASVHLDFVGGCFIIVESDGVTRYYFNAKNPMGRGTKAKGTNICMVKSIQQWQAPPAPKAHSGAAGAAAKGNSTDAPAANTTLF